uniref:Uncharacterized protein n=1 Tax=Ananas comosus var. bracteatus TaxID=296719 RepID=A0A6V7P991_ANACO|nr:unnamed protein product [Ananas comosus var. bracteatus]
MLSGTGPWQGGTGPIRLGWREVVMQPVSGEEEPVPERWPSERSRNLAKSRRCCSREPVSRTRTGLPGTGLSGKDRFPNAKSPLPGWAAIGDRSPRAGRSLTAKMAQGGLIQIMKS